MKITRESLEMLEKQQKIDELSYKQYMKTLKREVHKTNCADCGRFVEKKLWVHKMNVNKEPVCFRCRCNYDNPEFM